MTTRAVIYARISDARDGTTTGVDRQLKDCRKLCKERGWVIANEYVDNSVSAMRSKPRPQYETMMKAIAAGGVDVIVVWAVDRLYRRLTDLERLVDEIGAATVTPVKSGPIDLSSADGRMMARMMGTVAQHESEKKGERIARAYRERAEAGHFGGGLRRTGYNAQMTELDESEASNIAWAYQQIADGFSLRSVLREFDKRGMTTSTGKPFAGFTLRQILLRPANAGHAHYKGQIFEGGSKAPAIVEPALWAQVKAILEDPSRQPHDGKPAKHLLSGIARCGVCGGKVLASQKTRSTPGQLKVRGVYRCHEFAHVSRARDPLDEYVTNVVLFHLEDNTDRILAAAAERDPAPDTTKDVREVSRIRRELTALPDLLAAGGLDAADFAMATARLRARLAAVESTIAAASDVSPVVAALAGDDPRTYWAGLDGDGRRALLAGLVDHIRIDRVAKPGPRPSVDGIEIVWRG